MSTSTSSSASYHIITHPTSGRVLQRQPVSLDRAAWSWTEDTNSAHIVTFKTAQDAEGWINEHEVFARGSVVIQRP